ncbi:anillin-like [Callorhinchus milii]|uniref:anillin-like n=1 Tax=Callorhinchus milii TaxID=7868 RepID=UPI001C3F6441|nr:anillin-like [Callorhinchus milii]
MDPYTQKLLERTRARRENLQKKMSERPTAAGRQIAKRIREPLCEANNQPSEAAEEVKDSTKPSPSKRRCSDKVETAVSGVENKEPETPMATTVVVPPASQPAELVQEQEVQDVNPKSTAASVKNRMQQLAAQRQNWDGDGNAFDLDVASPVKLCRQASPPPPHQTPTSVQPGTPAGRRARLNNLAATISSWEDDLSRPTAKQNKPQGQPGTACLPVSGRAPATVNSSSVKRQDPRPVETVVHKPAPVVLQTVQSTKVIPPSPKKTEEPKPLATKGPINSDQVSSNLKKIEEPRTLATKGPLNPNLATLNLKKIEEPKPLETKGPLNPNLATLNLKKIEEPKPLETKGPLQSAQANSGLKKTELPKLLAPKGTLKLDQVNPSPKKTEQRNLLPSKGEFVEHQTQPRDQATRGTTALLQSRGNLTPGGTGVKSFLERFSERCQERSASNPKAPTPGLKSPVTPNTKAIQERLFKQQELSTTASLTQQLKQEREKELANIRNRFQGGNVGATEKKGESSFTKQPKETDVSPLGTSEQTSAKSQESQMNITAALQPPCKAPSEPQPKFISVHEGESSSVKVTSTESAAPAIECKEKVPSSPAKSSPLRKVMFVSEQLNVIESTSDDEKSDDERNPDKVGKVSEVEMSVDDELNSSAVINELFEGVMEEDEDVDDDEERESELNISSMSLLAPLAVASPELVSKTALNSPAKQNNNTPDNAKRSKFQRTRLTRAESTDSMGSSTDDQNLLYSIDAYRSQRIKPTERPPVKQIIVRKEDVTQRLEERRAATPSSVNIKQRMKNLSNDINIQQSVIHQASQALNCCTDEDHGKGSQQEAEAERLLLIASERRMVLLAELNKLKTEGASAQKKAESAAKAVGDFAPSRGSISLSEIRLPLKADFICSTAHKTDSASFYFFVLIRAGALNMVATPLASTQNAVSGDAITFPTKFTLQDVSNDFEIEIEVYSLAQRQEMSSTDKKKKTNKSKAITPKRLLTSITKSNIHTPALSSPGGPNAVRSSNFVMVGSYKIVLSSVGNTKFQLDKVPFLCPIQGHIYVKLQCQVGSSVEEHGFLTMFHDVSGFGAWHRRWCVLSGACISYWTYPDDEKCKRPLGRINLANCTSRKIDPANREFCARPNTFELITVRPQREDDRETLVSECKNTLCVTKNWLSADTKEERNLWMQKLNRVLVDLRTWQPDACYRPQVI